MRRLTGLVVVLALLVIGPAGAKTPHFKYHVPSIIPGKAIGGLEVGMSRSEAKTTWGVPDDCYSYKGLTTCSFSFNGEIGPDWVAGYYLKKGRVVAVTVETSFKATANQKVKRLKTAKKIHVGSPIAEARRKYDIPLTGGGEAGLSRANLKQGRRCTNFYAPAAPYKVISSITVGICKSVIQLYF